MEIVDSLAKDTLDRPEFKGINFGRQTELTFPYYEFYASMTQERMYIPPQLQAIYNIGMSVWSKELLPEDWLTFFNEVADLREAKGINSHFSALSVAMIIAESDLTVNDRLCKEFGLEMVDREEIIVDAELTKKVFNYFLQNEDLRERLKSKLADFIYFSSADWVDTYEVVRFIKSIGLKGGVILDLGCGTGEATNLLKDGDEYRKVIGIDRQFLGSAFDLNWSKKFTDNDNLFMQADGERVPLANSSVDLITMTSVLGHLSKDSIRKILDEVIRILKDGGYLIVGPQKTSIRGTMYRYFKKTESGFVEIIEG